MVTSTCTRDTPLAPEPSRLRCKASEDPGKVPLAGVFGFVRRGQAMSVRGPSRTSGDVRLESGKCPKADLDRLPNIWGREKRDLAVAKPKGSTLRFALP